MNKKLIPLLLDILHQDQNRLDITDLESLTSQEWTALIMLASRLRVRLLLYKNLKKRGFDKVIPEKEKQALKSFYTQNTIRNLRYSGELKSIVNACTEKKIPLIALKGIYLANTIYENIGLREMNDIDLLVPKKDLEETANIMLGLGYKTLEPFSLAWEPTFNHLPPFVKPGLAIEIHWSITTAELAPKFDIQDLWDYAKPVEIANTKLLSLSPNDILLYLCFHNAKHFFAFTLRPYCDIQTTILHFSSELDWEKILERAKKWGWERGVYLSLRLAKEFVGAEVPNHVLDALKPEGDVEEIYAMAKVQTFVNKRLSQGIFPNVANYTQLSVWKKIPFLMQRFFPSKLEMANKYQVAPNSPALFLKYPLRWRDLFLKHRGILADVQGGDEKLTELAEIKGSILRWLAES